MESLIKEFLRIGTVGDGYGDGSGSGDGYGDGLNTIISPKNHISEYRKGFLTKEIHSLKTFEVKPVYYIDDIPCYFLSIVGNMAKVKVIKDDFTTVTRYVAKQGDLFAHGETKEEALEDVSNKFYSSLSF